MKMRLCTTGDRPTVNQYKDVTKDLKRGWVGYVGLQGCRCVCVKRAVGLQLVNISYM